jgi:protein-tyrosine phosphatase
MGSQHITWILPNQLATRPGPLFYPWNLTEIKKMGFGAVISLSDQNEAEAIREAGLQHYPSYTPDIPIPHPSQQRMFLKQYAPLVDIIHEEITKGKVVLIHCFAGRDRSGLLSCCYLIKYEGFSAASALNYIRSKKDYCEFAGFEEAVYLFEETWRQGDH